jgi:uncharacterized membrane protein
MRARLRTHLITGLLVVLPLSVTVFVLVGFFQFLDNLLAPVLDFVGVRIPGLGLAVDILLILVAGAFASNVFGRRVVQAFDDLMLRIPLARGLYAAAKQLMDALFKQDSTAFKQVVLVEWPRRGIYSVGFITSETYGAKIEQPGGRIFSVFVMRTPDPITGFLCSVSESRVMPLEVRTVDAIKFVMTAGIVVPASWSRPGE